MQTLNLFDDLDEELGLEADPELNAISAQAAQSVPGLLYLPDFIRRAEESELLGHIDSMPWSNHWQRRTQFYGHEYERDADAAATAQKPATRLPCWALDIVDRLVALGVFAHAPNQVGVNEYLPGQGIAPHVDNFNGTVVSLSLGSGCVMDFFEIAGTRKASLWLAPRSILVMRGQARGDWMHGIARRQKDIFHGRTLCRERRVSILVRDLVPEAIGP